MQVVCQREERLARDIEEYKGKYNKLCINYDRLQKKYDHDGDELKRQGDKVISLEEKASGCKSELKCKDERIVALEEEVAGLKEKIVQQAEALASNGKRSEEALQNAHKQYGEAISVHMWALAKINPTVQAMVNGQMPKVDPVALSESSSDSDDSEDEDEPAVDPVSTNPAPPVSAPNNIPVTPRLPEIVG